MKSQISRMHYQKAHPLLDLLQPLAWGYGLGVETRLMAYRMGLLAQKTVPVPVISVGNLTTGGTGKTPVVLMLAEMLLASGRRVVILSRGYGAEVPVACQQALEPRFGDEAYFLQQQLPEAIVIVGRNRQENASWAIEHHQPDVILLDDGYQYLKLQRALNILLVDGENLFGNERLLPLGPLREPLGQMNRADLVWVTKALRPDALTRVEALVKKHANRTIPVQAVPFQRVGLENIVTHALSSEEQFREAHPQQACIAFSGIAQPDGFEADLRRFGLSVEQHLRFGDHHVYSDPDIAQILEARKSSDIPLITTEKDKVKIERLLPDSVRPFVYTLKIRPVLTDFSEVMKSLFLPYASAQ